MQSLKLFKTCKWLLRTCKLPYRRLTSIRKSVFRKSRRQKNKKQHRQRRFRIRLSSLLWPFRRSREEMDRIGELKSFTSTAERYYDPFPSPLTPAFVKLMAAQRLEEEDIGSDEDAEEACRSFEKYLVEMIVEEGKVRDLTDVEELLYCWSSLKSPVFVDLVTTFYGELCKELFH